MGNLFFSSSSSSDWEGSGQLNTALSLSISLIEDVNVAVATPAGSPRVLDLEEWLAAICSITNGEDSVIEVSSAETAVDTRLVELEGSVGGINGDRDGLLGNGSLEWEYFVNSNINTVSDLEGLVGSIVLAGSINSLVGVLALKGDSVINDVVEGIIHESSVASLVSILGRAVAQLLFGERKKVLVLEEVSTFKGSGGGESPARSALTLILDGGDGT